jgi:spermidine/putrescine transport system permease protein
MKNKRPRKIQEALLSFPSLFWLFLFFVIPTLFVFAVALRPANPYGGIAPGWTWANIRSLANPNYLAVAWRTVWISVLSTLICVMLAVPICYYLARVSAKWKGVFLMLIIVPFWTNFLIRVFAWKVLLHPEGAIKKILAFSGLVSPQASLLYNAGAVVLITVYTFLPFTILPLYASAEKFDFQLLEAARDLGARRLQAFAKVFLPGIRRGLITAVLFVFIPALGSYVIPDIVGGADGEMLGNKIAQRVFVDRNLPQAGALSVVLILSVLAPLAAALVLQRKRDKPASLL